MCVLGRKTGKFPDSLETFLDFLVIFLDRFETVSKDLRTFLYVVKQVYALLTHMLWKKSRTSSGKFLRVKVCRLES